MDQPLLLETYASSVAVGPVIAQMKDDGRVHPIQYMSLASIVAGQVFSTCERETLVVIFGVKKFRIYLLSLMPLNLVKDHLEHKNSMQKNDAHAHIARW